MFLLSLRKKFRVNQERTYCDIQKCMNVASCLKDSLILEASIHTYIRVLLPAYYSKEEHTFYNVSYLDANLDDGVVNAKRVKQDRKKSL